MKHLFSTILFSFIFTVGFAQNRIAIKPSHALQHNYQPVQGIIDGADQIRSSTLVSKDSKSPVTQDRTFVAGNVTAAKIGEASNAYTFVASDNHQISVLNSIGTDGGTIGFIYRQNIEDCGGENGTYRFSLSGDGGGTWNLGEATDNVSSGCFGVGPMNPDFTFASRYPNMTMFSPNGTDINMAYVGPVLNTTNQGWNGHVMGVVTGVPGAINTTQEDYMYQVGGQYLPYSLVERVPGEFWYVARESLDGDVGTLTESIVINKGTWDSNTNTINWSVATTLSPNFNTDFDGTARFTTPNIAFSPDGSTGYVGFLGDLVGGEDTVYSPIFIESTDGGASWEDPYEFNMAAYPELRDSLGLVFFVDTVNTVVDTVTAGNGKATTGFNMDITVDALGNPHILAIVGNSGLSSRATQIPGVGGSSASSYSISSGLIMFTYDFTKDENGDWNMLYLGRQATFRGEFGDDTSPDDAATITADPWMQLSRSSDGNVIFYSWTESDNTLTGNADNNAPNLIGRAFNISTQKTSPYTNWTLGDATWDGFVLLPKISPVSIKNNDTYTVPTVFMNLDGGSALDPVSFWYISDINYAESEFSQDAIFFYNCASNPFSNSVTPISANCGNSDGSISVAGGGGLGTLSYQWDAAAGNETTATVNNLPAGVYSVTITDSVGCNESLSVTLNNVGAPVISIDENSVSNISCGGEIDGSATVLVSGGTNPFTYEWGNGETGATAVALPRGITELVVTDASNCKSFISVGIAEPDTLSSTLTPIDVTCNGDGDGNISASALGGTGLKSFLWDTGETTSQIDGLSGGTFFVTITDERGCTIRDSVVVGEPDPLTVILSSTNNFNENEPFTGTATAIVSGGNGGALQKTFEWSNGSTQSFNFGLCGAEYWVKVTDPEGCTVTDTVEVGGVACLGVNIEQEIAAGISTFTLYPNPSTKEFRVSLQLQHRDQVEVRLVHLDGRIVAEKRSEQAQGIDTFFEVNELASGIYLLQVTTSKGSASRRVLVQ